MRTMDVQEATNQLKTHGVRYVSMINYLQMNPVEEIIEENSVIMARVQSDDGKVWTVVAADTPEQLRGVQKLLRKQKRFAGVEGWMYPYLIEGRVVLWDEPCYTYYVPGHVKYPEQERLPEIPFDQAVTVQKYWTYQDEWAYQFIVNSLQRKLSSMKFVDGQPVAWAGIQDDGAMGFMHVLKEYRRHGYAKEVTIDLIAKYRALGKVPFVHIVRTNQASMALAQSMGFELLKEIYWLELQ